MSTRVRVVIGALLLLAGCEGDSGTTDPSQSLSCSLGGTADAARFAQHFERMALVDRATGLPGPVDAELGERYAASAELDIRAESRANVSVRVCVQERSSAGTTVFDRTTTFTQGAFGITLGRFPAKSYVVRVAVDGTLVKNYPFFTQ